MLGDQFEDLLSQAAAGEAPAFAALWSDANPELIRYLRVLAGDHAEDVASEAWLKVIGGLDRFSGTEQGFRSWLVTIARRTYIDMVRKPSHRNEIPVEDVSDAHTGPPPGTPETADLALERMSTAAALEVIARLPPDQAEMIMLRVVIGLDVADVASIVDRSPGAVRVAVHRGLRRLAVLLQGTDVTADSADALLSRDD